MKLGSTEHMVAEWRLLKVCYGNDTGLVSLVTGDLIASTWDTSRVSMMSGLSEVVVEDCDMRDRFGDEHSWDDVIGLLRKYYDWDKKYLEIPEGKERGHWEDAPGHPVEDWQYEVRNGDTRQSYTEWIASRVEADPDAYCRTCSAPYDGHGDGYDGECPDCADKTEAALEGGGCGDDDDDGCPPREPSETRVPPIPPTPPRHTQEGVNYLLSVSSQQAGVLMQACDLLLRMRMGQVHNCLSEQLPWCGNFVEKRNKAIREATASLAPYLRDGIDGRSASYGVGSAGLDPHAKIAADLHDVIRCQLAWDSLRDNEKPGPYVCFNKPMHWGTAPLATIQRTTT